MSGKRKNPKGQKGKVASPEKQKAAPKQEKKRKAPKGVSLRKCNELGQGFLAAVLSGDNATAALWKSVKGICRGRKVGKALRDDLVLFFLRVLDSPALAGRKQVRKIGGKKVREHGPQDTRTEAEKQAQKAASLVLKVRTQFFQALDFHASVDWVALILEAETHGAFCSESEHKRARASKPKPKPKGPETPFLLAMQQEADTKQVRPLTKVPEEKKEAEKLADKLDAIIASVQSALSVAQEAGLMATTWGAGDGETTHRAWSNHLRNNRNAAVKAAL